MKRLMMTSIAVLALAACNRSPPAPDADSKDASAAAAASEMAAEADVDAGLKQLETVKPVDACAWLTPEKLKAVFPDLNFEVHQKLEPRMSGYLWDSRCTYWAGVGSIDYAKDVPTHTLNIFVGTTVSEDKAKANLASRHETATSATGYRAQTALGPNAYSTANTGVVSLFFVKGQSEVQINVSDLKTPNDEKIQKAIALAQSL
jgi:hypothetical protein